PTLPVPKSRNGVSLFALLSVMRSGAVVPLAQTNGCGGFLCETQAYLPGLGRHQNGPGQVGLDSAALIALATSKRLLRFVGSRPAFVPRSSCMYWLRYCQTMRQGGTSLRTDCESNGANPLG